MKRVDLNLLKVFVIVYQEKSVRRASEKLFLSPAAVSQSIKKLKDSLQEELFVLCGKKFLPTPYSDTLYQEASPKLEALLKTVEKESHFDPVTCTDVITLELNPHLTPVLTPYLVSHMDKQSPSMGLRCHTLSSASIGNLLEGKSDVLIHYDINKLPSELIKIPLGRLKFIAMVRKDHPFKKASAYIDELLSYSFGSIDLADLQGSRTSIIEDKLESLNKNINIKVRTTSISALIETVKNTNLITAFLEVVAKQHPTEIRTIDVLDLGSISSVEVYMFLHKCNMHSKKYKWLQARIKNIMENERF